MALEDVKTLRDRTGAGLMDCKNALSECNGDLGAAERLLKERGLAAMITRDGRATTEGRVFMHKADGKIKYASVSCETDFVAKSDAFGAFQDVLVHDGGEAGLNEVVDSLKISVRENIKLQKFGTVDVPENCAGEFYIHSDGKTAAIVVIEGSNADVAKKFAYECCLHLAAFTPKYIRRDDVPAEYIEEQKAIFEAQMSSDPKMSKLPDNVRGNVLNGKVNKHLAEICFVDQAFVKNDKISVAAALKEVSKALGEDLKFKEIIQITPDGCSVKEN